MTENHWRRPFNLRCEYGVDPLGVEKEKPLLTWSLASDGRGKAPAYFQIEAASHLEKLRAGEANLWDSGKMKCPAHFRAHYDGLPLQRSQSIWWRVRVWDTEGNVSPWSEAAVWEMGLLGEEDWAGAQWIGAEVPEPCPVGVAIGTFFWSGSANKGTRLFFRKVWNPELGAPLKHFPLRFVSEAGEATLFVNGQKVREAEKPFSLYEVDLMPFARDGRSLTLVLEASGADGPNALALGVTALDETEGADRLTLGDGWKCQWDPVGNPLEDNYDDRAWDEPELQERLQGNPPWTDVDLYFADSLPAPLLRKTFTLPEKPLKARAYFCGLGYGELYCNGKKVGDRVLDPGQTDYNVYGLYSTYDVTDALQSGENCLGIWLGNGWYNQDIVWGGLAYGQPGAILRLLVEYEDGREEKVVTDGSWVWRESPVFYNNVYGGERYDARREIPHWAEPECEETGWEGARVLSPRSPRLASQMLPPIRKRETLAVEKNWKLPDGGWVYDLGQNFSGWVRLAVEVAAGTVITLRFAEEVFPDGSLDYISTGYQPTQVIQTDQYICKGEGREVWEPRFTYHGFRYVEVTGLAGEPRSDLLEGVVVHTDVEQDGRFHCSDPFINRLHDTALWTERTNLHSVATDCPHRERCGWLGDAHVTAEMTLYNFQMGGFWKKYLVDVENSRGQGELAIGDYPMDPGMVCNIAPGLRHCGQARPDWAVAAIFIPWQLWRFYGETEALSEHFEMAVHLLDYLHARSVEGIVEDGFGDWCPPGAVVPTECPPPFTSTALFVRCLDLMPEWGKAIGKEEETRRFAAWAEESRAALKAHFFDSEKNSFGSHTADALALEWGLVEPEKEPAVAEALHRAVAEEHNYHFTCGIMGLLFLYDVLTRFGYGETAWKTLNAPDYPGYKRLFELGGTTFWESLWPDKEGIHGSGQSLNHPMQGGFDAWFYRGVAGLEQVEGEAGFRKMRLQPRWTEFLEEAEAEYKGLFGTWKSHWKREGQSLDWEVVVPPGAQADVSFPARAEAIAEGEKSLSQCEGFSLEYQEEKATRGTLVSGQYRFSLRIA